MECGLLVTQHVEGGQLAHLLDSVGREECAHSWRNLGPEDRGSESGVLGWENQKRPTEVFYFFVDDGRGLQIAAASAIAWTINRSFPHPGFCVLGRCYIMPEYRGRGLYRPILRYRLDCCRARLGGQLRGIHMGTDDQRIVGVISGPLGGGWPCFVHLGEEELRIAGHMKRVGDYLLLADEYVERMKAALDGPDAPDSVLALRNIVAGLGASNSGAGNSGAGVAGLGAGNSGAGLAGSGRAVAGRIKAAFEASVEQGWFDGRRRQDFDEFLLFCEAIPLIGFG